MVMITRGYAVSFRFKKIVYDIPSIRCDQYGKYIYEHIDSINYVESFNPNIKINCKKLLRIPIKKISSSKYIIDCVKASLLIKQSQWKHEKEVRLIIRNDDANVDIVEKLGKGFKIKFPYLKCIYTCSRISIFNRAYKETSTQRVTKKHCKKIKILSV